MSQRDRATLCIFRNIVRLTVNLGYVVVKVKIWGSQKMLGFSVTCGYRHLTLSANRQKTRHRASTEHSLTFRVRTMLSYREVELLQPISVGNDLKSFLGWATDGSGSDIKLFKGFFLILTLNYGLRNVSLLQRLVPECVNPGSTWHFLRPLNCLLPRSSTAGSLPRLSAQGDGRNVRG